MTILLIDGQGGALGKELAKRILAELPDADLLAVGTNSIATSSMAKAGVKNFATGENSVIVEARKADVIVGPVGIVIADALMGEVTPAMAKAVGQSSAKRVLIPMNKCDTVIAGVKDSGTKELLDDAMQKIKDILKG